VQAAAVQHAARGRTTVPNTPFGRIAWVADRAALAARGWPNPKYQRDPVAFAREVLGVEPWAKQVEILEAVRDHKRVAVCSGHKVSKSHSLAIVALWFYSAFEDARVVCTCVTARQVDEIFYREVKKMFRRSRQPLSGEPRELARSGIKSDDFREIVGFTAKESEAVAGISGKNLLYLVDEASGIGEEIFEAIQGNSAGGARVVLTSNPTRTEGTFFEAFHAKAQFWRTIQVSSESTPNVIEGREVIPGLATREWVELMRAEYGEQHPVFKVRVKGEFVLSEEGKIMSLHLLGLAEQRWAETPAVGRLQVGVDPAGPGEFGDETAFSGRRGQKQIAKQEHRGLEAEAIVVHLLDFLRAHRQPREVPIVCVDREGPIGSEVFGLLRAHLDEHPGAFEVFGVRSSDKAIRQPQIYGTVRDELHANAAEWLRDGGAILEDVKLTRELHAPSWVAVAAYGVNASRLKATDKKQLRKELGRSPDRADALLLSVWEPLALTVQTEDGAQPKAAADPYEDSDEVSRSLSPYGGSF